jgi:hypothetical protein
MEIAPLAHRCRVCLVVKVKQIKITRKFTKGMTSHKFHNKKAYIRENIQE